MTMTDWAEREIAAACKRENPNWSGKGFDYGCSCYQSALKAYKSLMKDDHSGYSFSVTRNILIKLLNNIPLSPITDEDFFSVERGTEEYPAEPSEWLKEMKLKSDLQCPRRSSLFRSEDLEGNVTYCDIDRRYCIDAECPSDTFGSRISKFIDELYPITMPYTPRETAFKVYVRTWLTDPGHGDFDVHWVIGYEDQDGVWHPCDIMEYYGGDGVEKVTDPSRKQELINARLNSALETTTARISGDIADIFTDRCRGEELYKVSAACNDIVKRRWDDMTKLCGFLLEEDGHGVCRHNTWHNWHVIVNGDDDARDVLKSECPAAADLIAFVDDMKKEMYDAVKGMKVESSPWD